MIERPHIVPYITPRDTEEMGLESDLIVRPGGTGLGYRDERPEDRDERGVLWARFSTDLSGRPSFKEAHPRRQREVMRHFLCQVCAKPADRTAKGVLFLLPAPEERDRPPGWPDGEWCEHPPVCMPCAPVALRLCPRLSAGPTVAVRVRKPVLWGAAGTVYRRTRSGGLDVYTYDVHVPYVAPAARWLVAGQLIRELRHCRELDLDAIRRSGG